MNGSERKTFENDFKLTLQCEYESIDISNAKEQMWKDCSSLNEFINDNIDVSAEIPTIESTTGTKGAELLIGTIVLAAFTSGAVNSLINCIKVWLESRRKEFTFVFEHGGKRLEIKSSNFDETNILNLTHKIKELISD